jgi:hypothetical protein
MEAMGDSHWHLDPEYRLIRHGFPVEEYELVTVRIRIVHKLREIHAATVVTATTVITATATTATTVVSTVVALAATATATATVPAPATATAVFGLPRLPRLPWDHHWLPTSPPLPMENPMRMLLMLC